VPLPSDPTGLTGVTYLWLGLSLLFAALCGIGGLRQAFAEPYLVQDDARTFLFWMERFFDPGLFPNDLMADYFSAVSPPGYTAVHWVAAVVFGLDPFVLNKLLPIVLGLLMTVYAFCCCMELFPVPVAAFAAATILNESVWLSDALPSGTPRAFIYPFFLMLVFAILRRRAIGTLVALALLGLFYPQLLTVSLGTLLLCLARWRDGRPRPTPDRRAYLVFGAAVLIALLLVGWATAQTARFGPVVTAAEAQQMAEFGQYGRTSYYLPDPWRFWVTGERPGMFPYGMKPPLIWLGLCLPVVAAFRARLPTGAYLSARSWLLAAVALASVGMFAVAHLFLFMFHLPSRYTQHSFRIVMALAAGIVIAMTVDTVLAALDGRSDLPVLARRLPQAGLGAIVLGALILYPVVFWLEGRQFPFPQYEAGRELGLYQFLDRQPKDALVASVSVQVDMLPTFARRSILTGFEYGIPYHLGYYSQIRQRSRDLIDAQYTLDRAVLREFVERYRVQFFLIHRMAYTPGYVAASRWIQEIQPEGDTALDIVYSSERPVLARVAGRCEVFSSPRYVLVDARCAVAAASS